MPENANGVTAQIAKAVAGTQWNDLPPHAVAHAERSFVNFVGCAAGGSKHEAVDIAEKALRSPGDTGVAPVVGRAGRESIQLATLLNCLSASVHAYDDTHAQALVHASSEVGSALIGFASGMQKVDGKAFLLSFAWGLEIMFRLSKAISVFPAKSDIGWSQSGITGAIGAAAACAKLGGLDEGRIAQAIGIAAAQAGGVRAGHGSMAMHLVPAQAANIGVQSALLSQHGFTGPKDGLEARNGFLQMFCDEAHTASLTDSLGQHFELVSNTFKAYPCGIVLHGLIDACLELRSDPEFRLDAIESIELNVSRAGAALGDRMHPSSQFEAQVSAQHWVAIALLDGAAGIPQGSLDAIRRSDVGAMRQRCRVNAIQDMPSDAAEVQVTLKTGATLGRFTKHFWGSLANPMRDDQIDRKFMDQAVPVMGASASQVLLERCRSLQKHDAVRSAWFSTAVEA